MIHQVHLLIKSNCHAGHYPFCYQCHQVLMPILQENNLSVSESPKTYHHHKLMLVQQNHPSLSPTLSLLAALSTNQCQPSYNSTSNSSCLIPQTPSPVITSTSILDDNLCHASPSIHPPKSSSNMMSAVPSHLPSFSPSLRPSTSPSVTPSETPLPTLFTMFWQSPSHSQSPTYFINSLTELTSSFTRASLAIIVSFTLSPNTALTRKYDKHFSKDILDEVSEGARTRITNFHSESTIASTIMPIQAFCLRLSQSDYVDNYNPMKAGHPVPAYHQLLSPSTDFHFSLNILFNQGSNLTIYKDNLSPSFAHVFVISCTILKQSDIFLHLCDQSSWIFFSTAFAREGV